MVDLREITTIPTTRYQGSKRKILPWLFDSLNGIDFNTVLDAFGGSGVVSYLFKRMGKKVTYNDIFRFNYFIGESIIENDSVLLNNDDIDFILNSNCNNSCSSFIFDTFCGIYYHDDENRWLDKVIQNIENLSIFYENKTLRYKKAIAYNALFQSCLVKRPYNLFHRKNLYLRTNNVKRNFGNLTTWNKSFQDHFLYFIAEINNSVFDSKFHCKAMCNDVFSIKASKFDLVYLDPPYVKKSGETNESSDYLRCYHFLEGIANYSQWGDIIDHNTLNKRIVKSYVPNYFTPKYAPDVFERLIKKFKNSIIVLSYRYGGVPTIEYLINILLKYKTSVKTYDKHYKYALNKQNGNSVLNREYILIGY